MPAATIRSATSCAAMAGVAMTPMATPCSATISSRSSKGRTSMPADQLLVALGVGVEQGHHAEPAAAEAGVVGQRVAEVADADDDHRPVLGHADLAGDLVAQVVDVVADSAGAVGAEVGEVLAQLGAVDAGCGREVLAGAGGDAWSASATQRAKVDGQTRDGGLGDVPGALGVCPCGHCSSLQPPEGGRGGPSCSCGARFTLGACEGSNKTERVRAIPQSSALDGRGAPVGRRLVPYEPPVASADRSRCSSTRQKSCWRPSTKVTGISSPKRSSRSGSSRIDDLLEGLPQVGADLRDDRAGVVAEVAARLAVEDDASSSLEETERPPPLHAAEPALLHLAGHADRQLLDHLDAAGLLEAGQAASRSARGRPPRRPRGHDPGPRRRPRPPRRSRRRRRRSRPPRLTPSTSRMTSSTSTG